MESLNTKFRIYENQFNPGQKYEKITKIGSGAYGNVYLVRDKETGSQYALKQYKNLFGDLLDTSRVLKELFLMSFFSDLRTLHPKIYRYHFFQIPWRFNILRGDLFQYFEINSIWARN